MKNITKLTLILTLFLGWGLIVNAQPPPPHHQQTTNQPVSSNGGNAPIGGGLAILLGLGAAWSGRKVYLANKIK